MLGENPALPPQSTKSDHNWSSRSTFLLRLISTNLNPSQPIHKKPSQPIPKKMSHLLHWYIEQYLTHHIHPSKPVLSPSQSISTHLNQFNQSQRKCLTSCTGPLSRPKVGTLVSPLKPYLWFDQILTEVLQDQIDSEYDINDKMMIMMINVIMIITTTWKDLALAQEWAPPRQLGLLLHICDHAWASSSSFWWWLQWLWDDGDEYDY